ncbi:MAG: hypothetical protein MUP36_04500, partial [Demequinaceae bacterium]|nr:hypothetical protein [Demequinaceae bacterium]
EIGETVDFGSGGVTVTTTYPLWEIGDAYNASYPGWMLTGTVTDERADLGLVTFDALVWVDGDGVIIGREEFWPEDMSSSMIRGFNVWQGPEDGRIGLIAGRFNLTSRGDPCDGVEASVLEGASIVFIHGAGPSADDMTWSWTRLTDAG